MIYDIYFDREQHGEEENGKIWCTIIYRLRTYEVRAFVIFKIFVFIINAYHSYLLYYTKYKVYYN